MSNWKGEAGFVQGEDGELAGVAFGAGGCGHGGLGLGVIDVGAFGVLLEAEGEEVGFHGAEAVEAPGGVGEGLGEVGFGGALGQVFGVEGLGVFLVGCEVVGGEDDDLAGKAVAEGVYGGTLFAGGGFGAGGFGGVGAVDDGALVGGHGSAPSVIEIAGGGAGFAEGAG